MEFKSIYDITPIKGALAAMEAALEA